MNSRKITKLVMCVSVAAVIFCAHNVSAQTAVSQKPVPATQPVPEQEREAIENIVHEYLLKHPEMIREAMQALQAQEEKQKNQQTAENLKNLRSEIYSDADSPALGNAKGDVSVVVFFDYFCGYCKKTLPALQTLLAKDRSLRIVFKEFPILSPQSLVAAKAALAAGRQGKFAEFHQAMLAADGAGEDALKAVSARLGVDYAKLQMDMNDPKIGEAIDRNIHLAESLNVTGTPAYLVGDQLVPGAIDSESLDRLIKDERAKLARN